MSLINHFPGTARTETPPQSGASAISFVLFFLRNMHIARWLLVLALAAPVSSLGEIGRDRGRVTEMKAKWLLLLALAGGGPFSPWERKGGDGER